MTREPSLWDLQRAENPGHSKWYIERFRALEETGQDLVGEARLIDAMAPREGRILDAGCGFGRHAAWLHAQGHAVVGVDGDDELIADARALRPGATWLVQDLSELDLPSVGVTEPFDVILCAGNVVTFVAPSTRIEVLRRMGLHLAARGRLVVGFGLFGSIYYGKSHYTNEESENDGEWEPYRWRKDSIEAIASGAAWGVAALVQTWLQAWRSRYPHSTAVMTGGYVLLPFGDFVIREWNHPRADVLIMNPPFSHALDFVNGLIEDFTPLAGDRYFAEDEAIVGGIGQPLGAVAGGFVIAFSEVMITYAYKGLLTYLLPEGWAPEGLTQLLGTDYKFAVSFIILVLVLLIRPTGIFRGKVL